MHIIPTLNKLMEKKVIEVMHYDSYVIMFIIVNKEQEHNNLLLLIKNIIYIRSYVMITVYYDRLLNHFVICIILGA